VKTFFQALRYAFDRTLNQLERLQGMQLGHPPKLEVQHSLS
jgi:hypothetical protein